jgi:hypothetical protein
MRFKIWKASITEYRIQDTVTGEIKVLENFTAVGCELKVNLNLYNQAEQNCFANSGNPFDYFAWIEAVTIAPAEKEPVKKVFYNPFKSMFFRDRETLEQKHFANKIVFNGNTLSYV